MKKRVMAVLLSVCLAFPMVSVSFADEADAIQPQSDAGTETEAPTEQDTQQEPEKEPETEKPTEKPTEPATEKPTEKPTEAATKAPEPTTEKKTETTTKSPSSSSSGSTNNNHQVGESHQIDYEVGDTDDLSSYLSDVNADPSEFSWRSSDSAVASVDTTGKVRARKRGTCTITAELTKDNIFYKYTFEIDVDDDDYSSSSSSSSSRSNSYTIDVGETKDLYRYVDDDYSASEYDWDTSNERYVTVTSRGVVRGVRAGSATVTAESESRTYTFRIKVVDDDNDDDDDYDSSDSSSKVSPKLSWDIYLGTSDDLDVSDILEESPEDYEWDVEDEDIVEVDEYDGTISAVDEGETTVTADGDDRYRFRVYVDSEYSTDEMSIRGKSSEDIEDYLDDDIDEYSFKSDRKDVATVSSSGRVTGVANGIASIICEHDDGSIIQVFVTVSGISTTTTTERTTEATTAQKPVQPVTTTQPPVSFTDISHRAWAIDAIKAMASKGYIIGIGANKFSPDTFCKRCDFVIVIARMFNLSDTNVNTEYNDIGAKDYYYKQVMAALSNGIEAGVTNNNFRPNDNVTREEVMMMVYKGLALKGISMSANQAVLSKYTDANLVDAQYKDAVSGLINAGLINGTSSTTIDPKAPITRAQMAVIMNRVDQSINK